MELDTDVLVVGAGLAGLGFGVQLVRKYGHRSFEIIEKTDNIGGTWFVNSYPGAGCDVCDPFDAFVVQGRVLTATGRVALLLVLV